MRAFISLSLLAASIALTGCSSHSAHGLLVGKEQVGIQKDPKWALVSADSGQATTLGPDSTVAYQQVQLSNVIATNSDFVATILCKQDSLGTLRLQAQLDPQRRALKKLQLLYFGNSPKHKVKQIGDGVGHYDPKIQRYYFTVAYQTITELPENMYFHSHIRQINGWISTETTTAALQPIALAR